MLTHTQLAPHPTLIFDHAEERVVFLGTPTIAVPTLRALAGSPVRPMAVITEPDKPVGRRQVLTPSPVKLAAQELGIAVSQPATADELLSVMQTMLPTIGVVVAYGHILTPELLAIPLHGFVNLHFSLLPRYRGATPLQAAILHGDAETGVTLMQIDPGLDTGPILGCVKEAIQPNDTTGILGERLAELAGELARELLPLLLADALVALPQEPTDRPVTKRLTKESGRIDWSWPARRIERFIRAMSPWPRAWTELAGLRFILRQAHLEDGKIVIDQIQAAGSRPISGSEFARGYPAALTELVTTGKFVARK